MSFVRVLLLVFVLAAPAVADAPTWSRSSMTAAASYFPAGTTAMVVAVGDTARPAAASLLEALQMSDGFEYVIDARGLGNVDNLADDEIVKRVFARPLKRVAIVRGFPAGASVKAVVTVYAAQGQVTSAFTLVPGKTLVTNPSPESTEDGVKRDEMQTVVGSAGDAVTGDGEITYQRQQVLGVTYGGVMSFEHVTFYKNGRPIADTPALYDAIGMQSEASEYRKRAEGKGRVRGVILSSLGITGIIGFGIWALIPGQTYNERTQDYTANDNAVPLALTLGSAALTVVGIWMMRSDPMPHQLSGEEAIDLVDKYNKKKRTATRQLRFAPSAMPSGAGVLVGGSF